MQQRMSRRKSAYDNAMVESFFSNLKNELIHHRDFATREHAKAKIFDHLERIYNRQRIHQLLGDKITAQFEVRLSDP